MKEKKISKILGLVLTGVQGVLSLVFLWVLFRINLLPIKHFIGIASVVLLLFAFVFWTQMRQKGRAIWGKIISVVLIIVLAFTSFYVSKMNVALDKVTTKEPYKIDSMVVAVLKEDAAQTLEDAKDYNFGVQYAIGGKDVLQAVDAIQEELGAKLSLTELAGVQEQASALREGTVQAIIYNEGYTGLLSEVFADYEDSIRILYRHKITTVIEIDDTAEENNNTFSIYISGNDVYGDIGTNSRSDLNIIVTINPDTRQVLLTTTPRDYYVEIPNVSNGRKDKLTHAGIYGVDASMNTLSALYETPINYYTRVNFTSLIEIVDLLGGIDVHSDYAFTTTVETYFPVHQGMNHFNGVQALAYARERDSLPGGDNQRGKNQQAMIVAIIKQMLTPQMLVQASGIIDSVSDNVDTNVPIETIQELIKKQIKEGGSWNIYSVAATGTGDRNTTFSMPSSTSYVMNPNMDSVQNIRNLINQVINGETIEGSEIAE